MVLERTAQPQQVLIVSHDVVGEQMAGPGIRYYHLARVLAQEFEVALAVPAESTLRASPDFTVLPYRSGELALLEQAIQGVQVVLVPAVWLAKAPFLLQSRVPLVVDGYNPYIAESLSLQSTDTRGLRRDLTQAYLAGDFFICASERQRDWWLGLLEMAGRVNTHTFRDDPSLRRLVDTVPFGLPGTPPQHSRQVMKGVWPGIGEETRIILWGGGLWPWLDPITAIRAVARIWPRRQDVRLVFPGIRHPNPRMMEMPTHNEAAFQAARELELLDQAVFFGEWIPYADWPNVLLESDLALTLHYDTLETRLAFRSRVLDYIWAGLPIIATRGDATSELIARYELGIVVDYGDADGVSEAILRLLEIPRETLGERFEEARQDLIWERAAQPLMNFCRHPRRAPDKGTPHLGNPYYQEKLLRLEVETARLEARVNWLESLVAGYERGKFIRLMRFIKQLKGNFGRGGR